MKDLTIVRYPHRGSATAVKSALNLYFHSRTRASCVFALSIVIWLIPRVGIASEALDQKFDGVVVPCQWVEVVPQINGVVSRILFEPGQHVSKGDVLFEMEADDFVLDVRLAQSELDEARAALTVAEDAAARQAKLLSENATITQLAQAQLALSRTRIAAPLSGTIGRPQVAPGAFVEAKKDVVLVEIAQLDPMKVYFYVPYVERQRALDKARTFDMDALFEKFTLSLELPTERIYELSSTPLPHGEGIEQSTDVTTEWAVFPNPHNVLIPGLKVHVLSHLVISDTLDSRPVQAIPRC